MCHAILRMCIVPLKSHIHPRKELGLALFLVMRKLMLREMKVLTGSKYNIQVCQSLSSGLQL